jgi:hypothetical protein
MSITGLQHDESGFPRPTAWIGVLIDLDAIRGKDVVEGAGELAVVVANEESGAPGPAACSASRLIGSYDRVIKWSNIPFSTSYGQTPKRPHFWPPL